jgi:hypothetical protein
LGDFVKRRDSPLGLAKNAMRRFMRCCLAISVAVLLVPHARADGTCPKGQLAQLYRADQKDREARDPVTHKRAIDWTVVGANDSIRLAQVRALLTHGCMTSSQDFYRAAVINQHGHDIEDIRLAFALATMAITLDPNIENGRFIVAATWDRILMDAHQPQWFATQYERGADGKWVLYKTDPEIVSDAERRKRGLPSLMEARQYATELNSRER